MQTETKPHVSVIFFEFERAFALAPRLWNSKLVRIKLTPRSGNGEREPDVLAVFCFRAIQKSSCVKIVRKNFILAYMPPEIMSPFVQLVFHQRDSLCSEQCFTGSLLIGQVNILASNNTSYHDFFRAVNFLSF